MDINLNPIQQAFVGATESKKELDKKRKKEKADKSAQTKKSAVLDSLNFNVHNTSSPSFTAEIPEGMALESPQKPTDVLLAVSTEGVEQNVARKMLNHIKEEYYGETI